MCRLTLKMEVTNENYIDCIALHEYDQFNSPRLKKKSKPLRFPVEVTYARNCDRGDSGRGKRSQSGSFSARDYSYTKLYEGQRKLKNNFPEKLSTFRNRHSLRSVGENTDQFKCPEGTFRVYKIFGDGNCMYRSVSYIIWGDEDEHRSLRTMVVEYIKDNWHDYSAFVMAEWNISNRQEYYEYMIANGTYATELECVVATKLYHMNLSIYREIDGRKILERIFHNRVNKNYRTARLLFSGNTDSGHYDVLIRD